MSYQPASSGVIRRPASVTFLVVLLWLNALLTLALAVFLILAANDASVTDQINGDAGTARAVGWSLVAIGLIVALVAIGIGKGSRLLRFIITVIVLFRIVGDIYLILQTSYDAAALVSIALNLFLLWLLWNSRANAFFTQR